jgi:hypothetical protein
MIQYIAIGLIGTGLWLAYEIWKAPFLRENPDGSYTTIRKEKKIMDLFKKKNKNQ